MSISIIGHGLPTAAHVSARFRKRRPGPESELVDWFLENLPIDVPSGHRTTAFLEPRLETGYPDLVVVVWEVEQARLWDASRMALTPQDLRLLQYLLGRGTVPEAVVVDTFTRRSLRSLRRLEAARLAAPSAEGWRASDLSSSFAVRDIIAVEAKMASTEQVLRQARLNTWFASASFVLVPKIPQTRQFKETAQSYQIDIWPKASSVAWRRHRCPEKRDLPRSYASWLFNEWAWQADRAAELRETSGTTHECNFGMAQPAVPGPE